MKKPKLITGFQAAHFERRAEEIFGSRLVSCKYYNRFIEVKFQVELDREYKMNYLWCNVVAVDREQITIYIHDWFCGMDDAMRQFNPFYYE